MLNNILTTLENLYSSTDQSPVNVALGEIINIYRGELAGNGPEKIDHLLQLLETEEVESTIKTVLSTQLAKLRKIEPPEEESPSLHSEKPKYHSQS